MITLLSKVVVVVAVVVVVNICSKFRMFHPPANTRRLYRCCSYCVCRHWRRSLRIMWAFQLFLQLIYTLCFS